MAAYRRVYDSRYLQADCQEPGSAAEPYARQSSMGYICIDRLTELFYVPLDTKQVISETLPQANLLAWYGKKQLNLTQQKHAFTNQKKCTTRQNKQKTKARFSHLLRDPAWKRSGSILKAKDYK